MTTIAHYKATVVTVTKKRIVRLRLEETQEAAG